MVRKAGQDCLVTTERLTRSGASKVGTGAMEEMGEGSGYSIPPKDFNLPSMGKVMAAYSCFIRVADPELVEKAGPGENLS